MLIYKSTNLINGKSYIGKTTRNLKRRVSQHFKKAQKSNLPFYNALNKYKPENFKWDILYEGDCTLDELNAKEVEFIELYKSIENGYNLSKGGDGGATRIGYKNTEETREKISKALKGRVFSEEHLNNLKGKKFTEEHKEHISKAKRCIKISDECKEKISKALKGRVFSEEHKEKISKSGKGRVFTKEHRQKLSNRNITDEWKEKLSKSAKGKNTGTIWINDGVKRIRINLSELEIHLNNGWVKGKSIK